MTPIRHVLISLIFAMPVLACAEPLYGVAFSVADIGGKRVIHVSDVMPETAEATKESVASDYGQRFSQLNPERAATTNPIQSETRAP